MQILAVTPVTYRHRPPVGLSYEYRSRPNRQRKSPWKMPGERALGAVIWAIQITLQVWIVSIFCGEHTWNRCVYPKFFPYLSISTGFPHRFVSIWKTMLMCKFQGKNVARAATFAPVLAWHQRQSAISGGFVSNYQDNLPQDCPNQPQLRPNRDSGTTPATPCPPGLIPRCQRAS